MTSSCLVVFTVFFRSLLFLPEVLHLSGWHFPWCSNFTSLTFSLSLRGVFLFVPIKHVGADSISFCSGLPIKSGRLQREKKKLHSVRSAGLTSGQWQGEIEG